MPEMIRDRATVATEGEYETKTYFRMVPFPMTLSYP